MHLGKTNKTKSLINLLEDMIDPEEKYPNSSSPVDLNVKERKWIGSTHNALIKETMKKSGYKVLPIEQSMAIRNYSSVGYARINNHLRHSSDIRKSDKDDIEHLKTLTKQPTEHEFTVYRGSKEKLFDHTADSTFKDRGFTSTTLRPLIARGFSAWHPDMKKKTQDEEKYIYIVYT